jgi:hypothetical protein
VVVGLGSQLGAKPLLHLRTLYSFATIAAMQTESTTEETRTNRPKGDGSLYQKADGRWYYSIMHGGKRRAKSLKTRDADEALKNYQKARNSLMGAIDRGEFEPSTSFGAHEKLVLPQFPCRSRRALGRGGDYGSNIR